MTVLTYQASPDLKLSLYRNMLRIRLAEERIADLYPEQEMRCPVHLCLGQEGVAAGVCANLDQRDFLFGTYRAHGLYLAMGGDMSAFMAEVYGKSGGITRGRAGSMQLIAPQQRLISTSAIVGGTIPLAVGAGLTSKMSGCGGVSVVVFGDGATEEGVFHESLNFAALKSLPVVFVCENNFYACYTHQAARQATDNIYGHASPYGVPGERIDGNDVMAVYGSVEAAVNRARDGAGPSLIECRTYRTREHVGPYCDLDLGYRSQEEFDEWIQRDPIANMRKTLLAEGTLTQDADQKMEFELKEEIDRAVQFARESPYPDVAELLEHVYV